MRSRYCPCRSVRPNAINCRLMCICLQYWDAKYQKNVIDQLWFQTYTIRLLPNRIQSFRRFAGWVKILIIRNSQLPVWYTANWNCNDENGKNAVNLEVKDAVIILISIAQESKEIKVIWKGRSRRILRLLVQFGRCSFSKQRTPRRRSRLFGLITCKLVSKSL